MKKSELRQLIREGIFDFMKNKKYNPGDVVWYWSIADKAEEIIKNDNPFLKDYTIGSMGPGDGKSYINIALSSKKDLNSQDLEYIVFFDRETFEVVDYEKT